MLVPNLQVGQVVVSVSSLRLLTATHCPTGTPLGTPQPGEKKLPDLTDFDLDDKPKKDTHQQALEHYAILVVIPKEIDWSSERQQGSRKRYVYDAEAVSD